MCINCYNYKYDDNDIWHKYDWSDIYYIIIIIVVIIYPNDLYMCVYIYSIV